LKQGKPIFKFGSHPSALDKAMAQENGSQATLTTHMAENQTGKHSVHRIMTEGDFYDNRGFRLEEEVEREKSELTKDLLAISSHVTELDDKRQLTYIRKHSYIHIYSIEICIPTNPSKLQNKKYIIQSYSPVKALNIINI
jgi:hypothetical protein